MDDLGFPKSLNLLDRIKSQGVHILFATHLTVSNLVPEVVGSPSWKCVTRPGWAIMVP